MRHVRITLTADGDLVRITPDGYLSGDGEWKAYVRAISGSRYDRKRRCNFAPIDRIPLILRRLNDEDFDADPDLGVRKRLQEIPADRWADLQAIVERVDRVDVEIHRAIKQKLHDYQRSGAIWIGQRHAALLADSPGLGKTRTILVALPANAAAIVIGPAGAKGSWRSEIEWCRPQLRPITLMGRGSFRAPKPGEILITNYELMPPAHAEGCDGYLPAKRCRGCTSIVEINRNGVAARRSAHLETCTGISTQPRPRCSGCAEILKGWDPSTVLIFDEVHMLKTGKSNRSLQGRALTGAARAVGGRVWGVTGTPMEGGPKDLWHVLQALDLAGEAFGDFDTYLRIWNARVVSRQSFTKYAWGDPDDEVATRLQSVSLRRMKSDVWKDAPTKTYRRVIAQIDKKALARCGAIGGTAEILKKLAEEITFSRISAIRGALAAAKIPELLVQVRDLEALGQPIVVFSAHRAPIDELAKRQGWATITGDVAAGKKREEIVRSFQAGKLRGLACTIGAAGTAITLTRARTMIFVDRHWNPTTNEQCEDRIHRLGQLYGCDYLLLVADHPIDRRLDEIVEEKMRAIRASVDASAVRSDGGEIDRATAEIRALQEEVALGRAVRRAADTDDRKRALEDLHALAFEGDDDRLAGDLAEEATRIGLSDKQWDLAVKLAARGVVRAAEIAVVEAAEEESLQPSAVSPQPEREIEVDGKGLPDYEREISMGTIDDEMRQDLIAEIAALEDDQRAIYLRWLAAACDVAGDDVVRSITARTQTETATADLEVILETLEAIYCGECGTACADGEDHDCVDDDEDLEDVDDDEEETNA